MHGPDDERPLPWFASRTCTLRRRRGRPVGTPLVSINSGGSDWPSTSTPRRAPVASMVRTVIAGVLSWVRYMRPGRVCVLAENA